jgi:hypothetical protein
MNAQQNFVSPESLQRKHESQNPSIGGILIGAGLVVLLIVGCLAIIWRTIGRLAENRPLDTTVAARGIMTAPDLQMLRRFPKPNLQLDPHDDLTALRAREDAELNGYTWVDRSNGVVRIPIDRAMDLIAQGRLPVRPANATARTGKSSLELIQERSKER